MQTKKIVKSSQSTGNRCLTQAGICTLFAQAHAEHVEDLLPFGSTAVLSPILEKIRQRIEVVHNKHYKPKGQNSLHNRKGCGTSKSTYYAKLSDKSKLIETGRTNGSNLLEYGQSSS